MRGIHGFQAAQSGFLYKDREGREGGREGGGEGGRGESWHRNGWVFGGGRGGGRGRTHGRLPVLTEVVNGCEDGSGLLRVAPSEADGSYGGVGRGGGRA